MKHITVIHHSASGGVRTLVSAFCASAHDCADADVRVRTRSADVCTRADLLASDALLFATPENFGYMAGQYESDV
jgi:multimeric flavodoxin WrbA